jgi:mRNA interferase MazF
MDIFLDPFDAWNEIKKKIAGESDAPDRFPKEGEVWMSFLGKNLGFEQDGGGTRFSRPVLIIKKFNHRMFWGIPLSSKQKEIDYYWNFTDPDGRRVAAILAQMRLLSIRRLRRKLYALSPKEFKNIRKKMAHYISP